jgi:hypothetical protein
MTYVELYNDEFIDLLDPENQPGRESLVDKRSKSMSTVLKCVILFQKKKPDV